MKKSILILFTFVTPLFSIYSKSVFHCPLTRLDVKTLMESSPYLIDGVQCDSHQQKLIWTISNKRLINNSSVIKKNISPLAQTNRDESKQFKKITNKKRAVAQTEIKSNKEVNEVKDLDFDFRLGAGGEYYSHSQSGVLGGIKIGSIFVKNFDLSTSYTRGDYKFEMLAKSYTFKYDSNSIGHEKKYYQYGLKFFYHNFFMGLNIEQSPLLKNLVNSVDMTSETSLIPTLGYQWSHKLSSDIETNIFTNVSASYLVRASSSDPNIKISNAKGFGGDANIRIERKLNESKRHPLYYFWDNSVSYRDHERNVHWGNSNGGVTSEHIHIGSTIGLKIKF